MSAGSIADHDRLGEVLDALLGNDLDPASTPLKLAGDLVDIAQRCGWDGQDNALTWAAKRVETYRRVVAQGRAL